MLQKETNFEYKYYIITMSEASSHSFMTHNNCTVYYKDSAVDRNVQLNGNKWLKRSSWSVRFILWISFIVLTVIHRKEWMKKSHKILGSSSLQWENALNVSWRWAGRWPLEQKESSCSAGWRACSTEGCIWKARGILVRLSRGTMHVPWIGEFRLLVGSTTGMCL